MKRRTWVLLAGSLMVLPGWVRAQAVSEAPALVVVMNAPRTVTDSLVCFPGAYISRPLGAPVVVESQAEVEILRPAVLQAVTAKGGAHSKSMVARASAKGQ